MFPAFALVSPPIVFALGIVVGGQYGLRLFEAFFLLGFLSPVLGLATLAILFIQQVIKRANSEPAAMSRRRVAFLAGLAIISPAWLIVMYFMTAVFNR